MHKPCVFGLSNGSLQGCHQRGFPRNYGCSHLDARNALDVGRDLNSCRNHSLSLLEGLDSDNQGWLNQLLKGMIAINQGGGEVAKLFEVVEVGDTKLLVRLDFSCS